MRTTAAALIFACTVVLPPVAARADTPVRRTVERSAPAAAHVRVEDSVGDVQIVGDDVDVRGVGAASDARMSTGDMLIHASPKLRARVEARTSVGDVSNAISTR